MSITLSDFASKVQNAPDDHLVQVKAGEQGILQVEIVATSDQTCGQHSVSQVALTPAMTPGAMRQGDIAYTQAILLQAIAKHYLPNTDVEAKVQEKENLARFDPSDPEAIMLPSLAQGESIKPLTCRDIKQIIAYAEILASQPKNLGQAPMEILQQIMSSLDHKTLPSAMLVNKKWYQAAVPRHAIASAERIHLLPFEQRVGRFVELFRFFTGIDLNKTEGKVPLDTFLVRPDLTSEAAGLASLTSQLRNLPEYFQLEFFHAILEQSILLPGDTCRAPLVALTERMALVHSPVISDTYDKIHAQAEKLTDRAPLLVALARQIHLLPDPKTAYDKIFAQAREMTPDKAAPILAALAGQIHALPESYRKEAFDALFDIARSMEQEHGAPILCALTSQIESLPEAIQFSYYDKMFNTIEALAPEHQSAGWAGLASQWFLLDDSRAPSYVDRMFIAIKAQSPEHQSASLAGLASQLAQLEPDQAFARFDKILAENSLLPGKDQLPAFRALAQLISTLGMYLEDSTLNELFDKLFNANMQLDLVNRGEGWVILLESGGSFGDEDESFDRYDRIFDANALSPGEYQGQLLMSISDLLFLMPTERKNEYFARLFNAMNQLPTNERAETLTHLQTKVGCLESDRDTWDKQIAQALEECAAADSGKAVA